MDGPIDDWQDGPGLVESIRRYRWFVAAAVLIGGVLAFVWSSMQPVWYEGVVRMYPAAGGGENVDLGRLVRSQAEYLSSTDVLERAAALTQGQLSAKELQERLTVEPARDANVIAIRVLDSTPQGAAALADTVVRAYKEVVAVRTEEAVKQQLAGLQARQERLRKEIAILDQQLAERPGDSLLEANREAKQRTLNRLADEREAARASVRAGDSGEAFRERAAVPDEPVQPKPLRNAALGALLGLAVSAGLAWWLNGRRLENLRLLESLHAQQAGRGEARPELTAKGALAPAGGFRRDSRQITVNGSPARNGSASGIADFDQVATSIQQLFRSLDGPPRKLYEKNLPHMVVEQITQLFPVDLAVILLKTDDGVRTMGSVGPEAVSDGTLDQAAWDLIDDAASGGPRLVYLDELRSLAGTGLEREEDVSLALVPLVRDQVGFGVLLTGRRQNDDGDAAQLGDEEVEQIAAAVYDMVPYLWAWLLLRSLKLRLGNFQ